MSRPKGWKPLSYATIATICGKLVLGQSPTRLAEEMKVDRNTVDHLRNILAAVGAGNLLSSRKSVLPPDVDLEIRRLVRTTALTNQEIKNRLGLSSGSCVRSRRAIFHKELRAKGHPVPLCKCGAEFQHRHLCRFKRCTIPKRLDPSDLGAARKALISGLPIEDLMQTFSISMAAATEALHALTPKQKKRRAENVQARRIATWRRSHRGEDNIGLFERLDRAVSKSLPAEVRAEMLQDMALRVLAGELLEKEAINNWQSFRSRAFRRLGDIWSNLSLDELRENGGSFIDMIEDEAALEEFEAFDEIELSTKHRC